MFENGNRYFKPPCRRCLVNPCSNEDAWTLTLMGLVGILCQIDLTIYSHVHMQVFNTVDSFLNSQSISRYCSYYTITFTSSPNLLLHIYGSLQ